MTISETEDETFVPLDTSSVAIATPTAAAPPNDSAIEPSEDDAIV